jgi:hypothetical protein
MGILTYIAIFGMTLIWIVGWMGISMIVGSFFELPIKTTCLIGALLGPLGFMLTLIVGFLENGQQFAPLASTEASPVEVDWDPFA